MAAKSKGWNKLNKIAQQKANKAGRPLIPKIDRDSRRSTLYNHKNRMKGLVNNG